MPGRNFREMIEARWAEGKFVCVGLDPVLEKLPACLGKLPDNPYDRVVAFNTAIVRATKDLACAYKPQSAYYEALGLHGHRALATTIAYINNVAPGVPVILDAKRNDIGDTCQAYARAVFDVLGVDAVTVNPYLGIGALWPFLERADRGVFILCCTSNLEAAEFQNLEVVTAISQTTKRKYTKPLYQVVASDVARCSNSNTNCGLVVGATVPEEAAKIREIVGDFIPFLVPGVGAQGGDLEAAVKSCRNRRGEGIIINSSRGIIYASSGEDFASAAYSATCELHNAINQFRQGAQ